MILKTTEEILKYLEEMLSDSNIHLTEELKEDIRTMVMGVLATEFLSLVNKIVSDNLAAVNDELWKRFSETVQKDKNIN